MTTPPMRLFFALPCPAELAARICTWRDSLHHDGQPVAQANLHLTLAFLGSVPRGRKAELRAIGERLPRQGFNLELDHIARWNNGILHLAPSNAPAALHGLVHALREELHTSGFEVEHRPFHPHITLARHTHHTPAAAASFLLPARAVTLFSSENSPTGVRYRAIGEWPLDSV
ncbi:RNA 2',3'-cyclic phosphodiesterase [Pseudomonas sp. BGr12]|uniref:RNA 2',3'-cyclic phosphodiesterase n=1 Tax=unclassified Pseudomonas TaxID=196821 RepID=UPI001786E742|nr:MULTISPECIES: RNA 2',3'-cyclic phosphodiesterase [unclassified Pseudomonas]MBD9504370.1 RNA 2',3'-cyclic phosphodiesterase [Pseudomonas sp. PDM17]MBD9578046.1 RNA 2',3'-cyclic phosphodiesterase [Pseudomonas sp. PDM23]MBD9672604.1 RNA 2',3'-cyclic phosphodiesterase [Pseudomonas sp. PDM21]MDL2427587.1 RNA 2',3'-cyclic phosphodiesterase [Pseudomonas sp. BJa5]